VPHIKAARGTNLIVVAPATADLLAKIANGICDDLLTNTISASKSPIVLVPAMHPEMWLNQATVANVATLRARGILVIEPDEGRMTGEDFGVGRYPEVSRIVSEISKFVDLNSDLLGKRILVTAGGTREAIDPVRYIGNNSSGKQGLAIAKAARNRGAEVVLVSANIAHENLDGIKTISVESTTQMQEALNQEFPLCDAIFMAAAVADAKPTRINSEKIKKGALNSIDLEANPDLIAALAKAAKPSQVLIAFAAETGATDIKAAQDKLARKGVHLLFLNDVSDGAIFGSDMTSGFILNVDGSQIACPQQSKDTLADLLLDQALIKLG
jgi:phosphopantothenoylcysteine decarboxylase/phosphopantothenate--cysteine ligase